jgi:hypothetical protein
MFLVSEEDAAAIRAAYEQGGELSAAVELRRLFPGIADNENARRCARTIANWTPSPPLPRSRTKDSASDPTTQPRWEAGEPRRFDSKLGVPSCLSPRSRRNTCRRWLGAGDPAGNGPLRIEN